MIKKMIVFSTIALMTQTTFSATVPAQAFSRANSQPWIRLTAPPGYYYNESVSYDIFSGKHRMYVLTSQRTVLQGTYRFRNLASGWV